MNNYQVFSTCRDYSDNKRCNLIFHSKYVRTYFSAHIGLLEYLIININTYHTFVQPFNIRIILSEYTLEELN